MSPCKVEADLFWVGCRVLNWKATATCCLAASPQAARGRPAAEPAAHEPTSAVDPGAQLPDRCVRATLQSVLCFALCHLIFLF
jgi:hypothetical protein